MLTIIIIALIILVIFKKKYRNFGILPTLYMLLLFYLITGAAYLSNIFVAPKELVQEQQRLPVLEEQLEALVSDFRYVPAEGDTFEKLETFANEYTTLTSSIEQCKSEIARHQRRVNPLSKNNQFAKFLFDFGITEKILSLTQ